MRWILKAFGGLLISCLTLFGAEHQQGFFFHGDIGPAFTRDTDVKAFIGSAASARVTFDTGVRVSFGGGYLFCPYFGLYGETGYIYNEIDSISGGISADARLMQVPYLANAVLQYPNPSHITPFIGGGGGGSMSILDIDAVSGPVFVEGTASDAVWAYQGFGGVKYEINDRLSVGVIYKYFRTGDSKWDVHHSSENIEFGGTETHSISAVVTFRF